MKLSTKRKTTSRSHSNNAPEASQPQLVGVVHLPPLPGAPRCRGEAAASVAAAARLAVDETRALEDAGFDAVILENFGDVPFFKEQVPAITIAAMTAIVGAARAAVKLPLGVNVLRNDGLSALAIAAATGCQFIRVNVLSGVVASDQGLIESCGAKLMRERAALGLKIDVWGDVLVKHGKTLSTSDFELAFEETAQRAMADAAVITGATTGRPADLENVRAAARAGLGTPIYIGSGMTTENLRAFTPYIDGAIVGSALRAGGRAGAKLEATQVKAFARAWAAAI